MSVNLASWLPAIMPEPSGYQVITVTGDAALTDDQFSTEAIEIAGAPSGDVTLTMPLGKYRRWLWNHTTGGHGLVVTTGAGNTVTIANGKGADVRCNGAEIRRGTADVTP